MGSIMVGNGDSDQQRNFEELAKREDKGDKIVISRTFYWNWDDSLFRLLKKLFRKEDK